MDPLRDLQSLQQRRGRPEKDLSIHGMVRQAAETLRRTERQLGDLAGLWEQVVPPHVAVHSRLVGIRSGVLHVQVDSASVRYELDRLLRAGAFRELQKRHRGTLVRVQVRLGGGGFAQGPSGSRSP
ncbi:MAG: DciA family protein [Planctomycetota bacterium]|jgi:hypothetical protein